MSETSDWPDVVGIWQILRFGDAYWPLDLLQWRRESCSAVGKVAALAYPLVAWLRQWVRLRCF